MVVKMFVTCNICGSAEYTSLYKDELGDAIPKMDYNFSVDTQKTCQIVKCDSCGFVYVNPMPDLSGYYKNTVDEIYLNSKKQRLRTAEISVQEILRFKESGNLLEIGCSTGHFLDVASKHFKVEGIELSEWAYKEALKRHKVYNMPLSELNLQKKFDVITLFEVIEHVTDPSKELDLIFDLLKPGGLLVISTPDIDGWLPRLMGKKWWQFMGMHLCYFSKATCKLLLEKKGFKILKITNYTHVFQLFSIGISMSRYSIGKIVKPILSLPFIRDLMIPLKLSGEMLIFALRKDG